MHNNVAMHFTIDYILYSGSTVPVLEPKVRDLMNDVASLITAKWQEKGIQLGLEENDLDTIQLCSNIPNTCFEYVFGLWKRKQCSEYSWTTICTALTSMNKHRLARTIKEKYLF